MADLSSDRAGEPAGHCRTARGIVSGDQLSIGRVVLAALLVSLLWKLPFFLFAARVYLAHPLHDPFFPAWLQAWPVSAGCYLAATGGSLAALFLRGRQPLRALLLLVTVSLAVLVLHQHSYNDVTFYTCAWSSLWCLWWFGRRGDDPDQLVERGALLAHLILSMILLGGAVGKMTPGYWSGEVLYNIYFSGRDYWLFNLLRGSFDEPALRVIACGYSRFVIITELLCGGLWLLPRRIASTAAIAVLLGIALASNTWLFSVLTCLLGLALVGLHSPKTAILPSPRVPSGNSGL